MTIEAVIEFFEATSEKEALRQDLAGIMGVGDGDISSVAELDKDETQALLGGRGILVATFADQQGFKFTVAELNAVVGVFQRFKAGELSATEFARALGLGDAKGQMETVGKVVELVYRGVHHDLIDDGDSGFAVIEFMKKTAQDDQLRQELQGIMDVGDGDISSFSEIDPDEVQALKSERGAVVAEFAARHGFFFTMADLFAVTDLFQRVQSGELSKAEGAKFLRLNAGAGDFFPFIKQVAELTYKGFVYSKAIPVADQDNTLAVVRFMEKSGNDELLRAQLQAIIGGDGDISDPGRLDAQEALGLRGERSKQIVDLGTKHGFRFTVADLNSVVGAFQLVNSGELSSDSCARILGLGKTQKPDNSDLADIKKTAGMIYRGVRY